MNANEKLELLKKQEVILKELIKGLESFRRTLTYTCPWNIGISNERIHLKRIKRLDHLT